MDLELFRCAQESLREYMERNNAPYEKKLLHQKVRCGICGHVMERIKATKPYYRCRTPRFADTYSCPDERAPEKDIMDTLLVDLRVQAAMVVELSHIWEEKHKGKRRDAAATRRMITTLKENLEQQGRQIKALYESFALGEISKAEYLAMKSAVVKERDHIADEISRLTAELENAAADGKLTNRFVTTFQKYAELDELTNEIVADAYEGIFIYPAGRLEIVRKYQDELSALLLELEEEAPKM